ncbi:MAG: ABC transporter ATP-binding protein [Rhodocyclaceae bacterium]|nr:MAG: ABC transporter ATP-binding protein [Rhodocyclaceae bacterium]
MVTPLLKVTGLCKSFSGRMAVDGVSFTVASGQTLGLIGPNGAGKSTTVSMLCGLLQPDRGEILMDGQAVNHGNNAAKHKIGLVPQELAIYEELSARENLRLFGALYGLSGDLLKQRCLAALELVALGDRAGDKPATYSGGMKRRLNIAAALLHDPQLLILDEPTVGIDPQSRNAIFDSLETLKRQGRSLIYTSHYMEEVERLADHIVIIDHGKVIANETPEELFRRLPSQAALSVELGDMGALSVPALLDDIRARPGVTGVALTAGESLQITLGAADDALPMLEWLTTQGCRPRHFATARTDLEEIFLTLTGHSLRD